MKINSTKKIDLLTAPLPEELSFLTRINPEYWSSDFWKCIGLVIEDAEFLESSTPPEYKDEADMDAIADLRVVYNRELDKRQARLSLSIERLKGIIKIDYKKAHETFIEELNVKRKQINELHEKYFKAQAGMQELQKQIDLEAHGTYFDRETRTTFRRVLIQMESNEWEYILK